MPSAPLFFEVEIDLLEPNPWNPNQMSDDMLAKEIESIHQFGFVDPITVREVEGDDRRRQIIDGEHRWSVAKVHSGDCVRGEDGKYVEHVGMKRLPTTDLGMIPDDVAQKLTIVLNETRGEAEPRKLGALLNELLVAEPMPKLLELLPFSPARFEELAELPKVDWNSLSGSKPKGGKAEERRVERVYRLPVSTAERLDEAIREAKAAGANDDGEALRAIAEGYLEGG